MKTIFICILFFTMILSSQAQEWNVLNEGMGHFRTIDFVNDNVGWLAGEDILLKTEDVGDTWYKLNQEDTLNFAQIDFYTDSVGWALAGHILLKTISGGQSWTVQKVFDYSWDNKDINSSPLQVLNDSVAFVSGGYWVDSTSSWDKRFYKTEDGGSNWSEIILPANRFVLHFWFINPDVGIVTSGEYDDHGLGYQHILRTTDGGTTWNDNVFDGNIRSLQFVNDSSGYITTYDYDAKEFSIWATNDSGKTWTFRTPFNQVYDNVFFLDENTVFTITDNTDGYNISKSTNGGFDWENTCDLGSIGWRAEMGAPEIHAKIYFTNDTGYLIVHKGGWQLLRSVDRGNTWKFQILNYPLGDVQFFDNDHGLVCGSYVSYVPGEGVTGDVFRTNDGGQTWDLSFTGETIFSSLFFVDDYTGLALSERGGYIYKTTNRGDDWYLVYSSDWLPDTSFSLYDIFFTSEHTGWACGVFGKHDSEIRGLAILGTIDGGENWNPAWQYQVDSDDDYFGLSSICFTGNKGWAIEGSGSGIIVKYTEQDPWQIDTVLTDLPLNDVFFSDPQHGWIAGGYGSDGTVHSILFHTKDAGRTWDEIQLYDYLINDMYFADSLHGWAVGSDTSGGIIIETRDGGINWTLQMGDLPVSLHSLYFKNGVGWAVGGYKWGPLGGRSGQWGIFLRTDNWTTWVDQSTGRVYPSKYQLSQNYPNPFNPVTMINYQLPMTSAVELSIYNLLGQKVATLVNKRQTAGTYSVEWDASGFASGIYLYRLEAEGYVETKKMILMK